MTKLRHWDGMGTARFVTFSCFYRKPYLNQPGAKRLLADEIDRARIKHNFKLIGYVLMPGAPQFNCGKIGIAIWVAVVLIVPS
ncbi:MAG: hypothetical protein Kow0074_06660 [Candidatus Zixiibacteriota bacterium]